MNKAHQPKAISLEDLRRMLFTMLKETGERIIEISKELVEEAVNSPKVWVRNGFRKVKPEDISPSFFEKHFKDSPTFLELTHLVALQRQLVHALAYDQIGGDIYKYLDAEIAMRLVNNNLDFFN